MRQLELASIVNGLKSEFSKAAVLDRKSVADRANGANLAALDMMLDGCETEMEVTGPLEQARALRSLAHELQGITGIIGGLAAPRQE
jgi:hypothetical protein